MKSIILQTERLLEAAQDPEYRFLLLEPILSYGIAFGILLFIVGFLIKHEKIQISGLITTGLAALSFVPYLSARRESLPRIEQIYRLNISDRGKLFSDHTILWSNSAWLYTIIIIIATATMIVGARKNHLGYSLSAATLLFGLIAIQNSLWIHYQDATAAYPNLKSHRAPIEEITRNTTRSSSRYPEINSPGEKTFSSPLESEKEKPRHIRPISR